MGSVQIAREASTRPKRRLEGSEPDWDKEPPACSVAKAKSHLPCKYREARPGYYTPGLSQRLPVRRKRKEGVQ